MKCFVHVVSLHYEINLTKQMSILHELLNDAVGEINCVFSLEIC